MARKKSAEVSAAFERVERVLRAADADFSVISHPPVISTEDVKRHIQMTDGLPVKTLLFRRKDDKRIAVVILPASVRVDVAGLAKQMDVKRLYFGSDRDVLAVGFPLGGLAPFGFPPGVIEHFFFDRGIANSDAEWVYMGSGDNSKTLKIRRSDLLKILESYKCIDA